MVKEDYHEKNNFTLTLHYAVLYFFNLCSGSDGTGR